MFQTSLVELWNGIMFFREGGSGYDTSSWVLRVRHGYMRIHQVHQKTEYPLSKRLLVA
jgi:hypothetical protein